LCADILGSYDITLRGVILSLIDFSSSSCDVIFKSTWRYFMFVTSFLSLPDVMVILCLWRSCNAITSSRDTTLSSRDTISSSCDTISSSCYIKYYFRLIFLQMRLMQKLGDGARPFALTFPQTAPNSVLVKKIFSKQKIINVLILSVSQIWTS